MSHEFDRGGMTASSWHREETIVEMITAEDMIRVGRSLGAYPVNVWREKLQTVNTGVVAQLIEAIVADYENHPARVLGAVGGKYHAMTPDNWNEIIQAAVDAGAKPVGAFSLRNGTRVLAVFEISHKDGWIDYLTICDSFDGSTHLQIGFSSIKVVCMNTYNAAMARDGKNFAKIRHTASLHSKVNAMKEAIKEGIRTGKSIRELYDRTEHAKLSEEQAHKVFDMMFPPADAEATDHAKTRAENKRAEAVQAMQRPENNAGDTLATLWNAATFLVDRDGDGAARPCRGGADMLDSLLFGTRAKRVAELQHIVEVVMRDGTIQEMSVSEAVDAGALDGRQLLDAMLDA